MMIVEGKELANQQEEKGKIMMLMMTIMILTLSIHKKVDKQTEKYSMETWEN